MASQTTLVGDWSVVSVVGATKKGGEWDFPDDAHGNSVIWGSITDARVDAVDLETATFHVTANEGEPPDEFDMVLIGNNIIVCIKEGMPYRLGVKR